jgi:pyridoxine 5-phosphate synthase
MIRLGVNIDHVATIRNARGGIYPSPVDAALLAAKAGANGITAHLREDRRHIKDADISELKKKVSLPLNFEMAATEEMLGIALAVRPNACCLVPERREEVTTEGGLNVAMLKPDYIKAIKDAGIRVSLFIEADFKQLDLAANIGADIVELHTGAYAHGKQGELERIVKAAEYGAGLGLEIHAGHGLTYANTPAIAAISQIEELNIGHFIIGQAVFEGLENVIKRFRQIMDDARS